AQFRLPVVHQMVEEIEAEPDLVGAPHPACIGVESVGLVVAQQRVPSLRITQGRIIRTDGKRRDATLQWVRPIRPRHRQRVRSEIRAKVRGLLILAESGPAERRVYEKGGRDGIGLPDARCLHERVAIADAAVAQASPSSLSKTEVAMNKRV